MKWKMATVSGRADRASAGISKRASVPGSADQAGRAVARGRTSGRHGAAAVGQDGGRSRTARDRGEPWRSRRHDRSQIGAGRGAGRLHAADGKHEHASRRAEYLQERRLPRRIVRAGRSRCGRFGNAWRPSVSSGQLRCRVDCGGEVQAGHAEFRLGRDRNASPYRRRTPEGPRADRHQAMFPIGVAAWL